MVVDGTIGSTLLGEGVDTIGLLGGHDCRGFPWNCLYLAVTNYVFKVGVEVLMTPLTYRIVNGLKRAENEDYYDTDTRFTPFAVD